MTFGRKEAHVDCSTTMATIRRTIGNAKSSVGNATIQEAPQAPGQAAAKLVPGPMLVEVATADTIADIKIDRISGINIRAELGGSFLSPDRF